MENSVKPFKCLICNKFYKSINSLGNHTRIFHPEKCKKNSRITQKPSSIPQKPSIVPQKTSKKNDSLNLQCSYCSKILSRPDHHPCHGSDFESDVPAPARCIDGSFVSQGQGV